MGARAWLWTSLLLLALPTQAAFEPIARAAPPPPKASADPRAAALFKEGRAAMEREDYAKACPKFEESARIEPAPGTLLNLALCQENLGQPARALKSYRAVIGRLAGDDERLPFAKEQIAALEKRVARLTLELPPDTPPGARVLRDGEAVPAEELGEPLFVDPGPHEIVLEIPGAEPRRTSVSVGAGQQLTVRFEAPSAAAPDEAPSTSSGMSRTTLGFIVGGVGAASLTAGLITGAMVLGKKATVDEQCDAATCATQEGVDAAAAGSTLATISTITFIAGLAGLGAGAFLVLTDDGPPASSARARGRLAGTVVAPQVLPGGGGVLVWRRF